MKKIALALLLFLTLSLLPVQTTVICKVKYPALVEGAVFVYNVTKPVINASGVFSEAVYIRYWDYRYEVLEVNDTVAVLKVNHTEYINGTPIRHGGYITYVFYNNLKWFEVFFDTSNINESVETYVRGLLTAGNSTYTIEKVNYNFKGRSLPSLNISYVDYSDNSFGYLIVSIDYGLVLEKAHYRLEQFYNTTGVSTQQTALAERIVLRATNLFFLLYRPIIVISIIIIAVIVAVIIIRRKTGKIW